MEWSEIERAMVVFAHPDDAEFGTAGTAALLAQEGKHVVYVVVTDGSKGSADPQVSADMLATTRQQEQRRAADILGVKEICFLNFEDGMLEPTLTVRKAIAGAIRRYKPDVVIAQNPVRDLTVTVFAQHPDHLAAGEATLAAVYPTARDHMSFPELLAEGLEPHAAREVWIVGTSSPNHFVDITTTLETKISALQSHRSQVDGRDIATHVTERARLVGEPRDIAYAEAYSRIVIS
ncbi:MAG: PIG-L family deacetylase [Chloroflexota bacterium]